MKIDSSARAVQLSFRYGYAYVVGAGFWLLLFWTVVLGAGSQVLELPSAFWNAESDPPIAAISDRSRSAVSESIGSHHGNVLECVLEILLRMANYISNSAIQS